MDSSWLQSLQKDYQMNTDQCDDLMDYIDEELAAILGDDFPLSPAGSDSSSSTTLINIPGHSSTAASEPPQVRHGPLAKHQKPENFSKSSSTKGVNNIERGASVPVILKFGNANFPEYSQQVPRNIPDEEGAVSEGSPKGANKARRTRPPSQTYDHIMAERKRREQLSQRFVALSAIVPGLKKMDKTSVLGETIKYLEHLQAKVKTLEHQATKQTMESVVLVKKSHINMEEEGSSDEKCSSSSDGQPLPEIEARVCNKSILVKIHCEKCKSVLVKILGEVEKMNLSVVNTSVTAFGNLALDITIIAEMEIESSVAAKDIVKTLRFALLENLTYV